MSQVRAVLPSGRGATTTQRRAFAAVLAFSLAASTGTAASSAASGPTPEDAENGVGDIELLRRSRTPGTLETWNIDIKAMQE